MTTQTERVFNYINEFGSISALEAFKDLGVTRLSARIFDLEKMKDIKLVRTVETGKNRYGEKTRWTRYSLKR